MIKGAEDKLNQGSNFAEHIVKAWTGHAMTDFFDVSPAHFS